MKTILFPLFAALVLTLGGAACNERKVQSTSIALRALLTDTAFNLAFIESVEILIEGADPARPIAPDETTAPIPSSYEGLAFDVEAKDFNGDGRRDIKLTLAGNPFTKAPGAALAGFLIVFESKSAGSAPLKITLTARKGTRVIATGTTDKNVEGAPIVTVDGERRQVELQVKCAADFACTTGNQAPVFTTTPTDLTVAEGGTPSVVQVRATDPDGHAITYGLEVPDAQRYAFMSIDPVTGDLRLAPGYADAGAYPGVVLKATDAGTPNLTARATITVTVTNTNRPPRFLRIGGLDPTSPRFEVRENEQLVLRMEATDDDPTGNTLSYAVEGLPITAIVNADTGLLVWTPSFDLLPSGTTSQEFPVVFTVKDSDLTNPLSARVSGTIKVENVNRAPTFTATGLSTPKTVTEGEQLQIQLTASDPDGDTLSFGAQWVGALVPPSLQNATAALDASSGLFSWRPGFSDQSAVPYRILFTVTDGHGGSEYVESQITVLNANRPPTISAVEATAQGVQRCSSTGGQLSCSPNENETITLALTVTDDPEDSISRLELVAPNPAPSGSSLVVAADRRTATFSWLTTYGVGGTGPVNLVFGAADSNNATATLTVPVTVVDVNRPPVLTVTEEASGSPKCSGSDVLLCTMAEGQDLAVLVSATDDPGETITSLTAALTSATEPTGLYGLSTNAQGQKVFSFQPSFSDALHAQSTQYVFLVSATDNKGATSTKQIVVTVTNFNHSPVISLTGVSTTLCPSGSGTTADPLRCTIDEGVALGFGLTVNDDDVDDTINLFTMSAPTATGAVFSPASGNVSATFSWTPGFDQGGYTSAPRTYPITFSAQDSQSSSAQFAVSVTVKNVNRAPLIGLASGTVGPMQVCKGSSSELTCYVDSTSSRAETLVLRLAASDPDSNGLALAFVSDDLPQVGPVFDPFQQVFSFTPPLGALGPMNYTARFTATDDDRENPLTRTLTVHIAVNAVAQPPTLTRLACPNSVTAGQSLICTIRIDDPDPRKNDLFIESSFIAGGSFSYDGTTRIGTFIMVPSVTDWGLFQVDFTGTQGILSVVDHYIFHVQRSDIATPSTFPVIGGPVEDMVHMPPYLYTANAGFVSSFNVPSASLVNPPRQTLIPEGARALRGDASRNWLYVIGDALKVYEVQSGELRSQLVKFNLPDGHGTTSFAIQNVANDGGTTPFAFVAYNRGGPVPSSQIDIISLQQCTSGSGLPTLCPLRLESDTDQPPSGLMRLEMVGDYLCAIGRSAIRFFQMRNQALMLVSEITATGFVYGSSDGKVRHPDVSINTSTGRGSLVLPVTTSPLTWEGYVEIGFDYPTFANATQTTRQVGQTYAVNRAGSFLLTAAGPSDVRRFDATGSAVGSVTLSGDPYTDLLVGTGSLGFAVSSTTGTTQSYLSVLDLSNTSNPVKGAERVIAAQPPGRPAVYTTSTSPAQVLLYAPRNEAGIEIYDISSPATSNLPINILASSGAYIDVAQVHGSFLIGNSEKATVGGRKHAFFFNLAQNATLPTEVAASGFELAPQMGRAFPFTGASGQRYVYWAGSICKPSCATATATPGVYLLELTTTGVLLRNALTGGGAPISIDLGADLLGDRQGLAINGSTLYRTTQAAPDTLIDVYDLTAPTTPSHVTQLRAAQLNLGAAPQLVYGSSILLALGSAGSGVAAFFSVDASNPALLTRRGLIAGLGDVLTGTILSASRSYLSSSFLGLVRIDTTDLDHPKIIGGQDSPNDSVQTALGVRAPAKHCCDGKASCLGNTTCTSDSQCATGQHCLDVNLLVAGEPSTVTVFELFP